MDDSLYESQIVVASQADTCCQWTYRVSLERGVCTALIRTIASFSSKPEIISLNFSLKEFSTSCDTSFESLLRDFGEIKFIFLKPSNHPLDARKS
jgi:hypothetical protein